MTPSLLHAVDKELWCARQPLRFLGVPVGARMTVIRLGAGQLFVHSPIALRGELRAEVDALGSVRYLVAPNRYHHLFIQDWLSAYPQAQAFAAPGVAEKRRDVAFAGVLGDGEGPWAPEVLHALWRGAPRMGEVHFLHRPTRTLILTDAVHNFGDVRPAVTRAFFALLGGSRGFRTTLLDRLLNRDRVAARASLEQLLRWDFGRVIMAHGEILEEGGPAALAAAYRWLRPDGAQRKAAG